MFCEVGKVIIKSETSGGGGSCLWQAVSRSAEETERLGAELGRLLEAGDFVSLVGELGAGKTVFARGIARGLGVASPVSSASFLILQEHPGTIPFFHADFYRLESYAQLEEIGWEEYLGRGGVLVVEWGERFPEALPPEHLEVVFSFGSGEEERLLEFRPLGRRYEEKVEELARKCSSSGSRPRHRSSR